MPSLEDVANDLKGLLGDIRDNTNQTNAEVNQTNAEVNTLIGVDQGGFANPRGPGRG
jgi:uncharacterized protein YukE